MNFHERLEVIEVEITHLFALVSEDLVRATDALLRGDRNEAAVVSERDQILDDLYPKIEDTVATEIANQAPMAGNLRYLLSVLRIVPELERSHDLIVDIAAQANLVRPESFTRNARELVHQMGDVGAEMWNQTADCWYSRNAAAADALRRRDDDMDRLHDELIRELRTGRMGLAAAMDMTLIARYYERLGNHSVNIGRRVVYLAGPGPRR